MDDVTQIMEQLLKDPTLKSQYTDLLLMGLEDAQIEEKREIATKVILINSNLISKYASKVKYQVFDLCEFDDVVSTIKRHLLEALLDDKIINWEDDFPIVFCKILDKTKRELAREYSEGGIAMSYSTRARRVLSNNISRVNSIFVENSVEIASEVEENDFFLVEEICENNLLGKMLMDGFKFALEHKKITKDEYELMLERVLYNNSFVNIAKRLGENDNTVRVRYSRTMKKIRAVFEMLYPEIEAFLE